MRKQFRSVCAKKIAIPKNTNVLTLAVTMFSGLDWPRLYIGFPEVVGDNAVRPYDPKCVGKDEYRKFVCEKYQYRYVGCTGTSIRFAKPDSMMRTVVEMCGKDPDTATAAEMDALDVRLITRSEIKNWRSAVSSLRLQCSLLRRIYVYCLRNRCTMPQL